MKKGTEYAKRVKRMYRKHRDDAGQRPETAPTEPLEQLVRALLSWEASDTAASKAYRELMLQMTDLNEVRVSSVREISVVIREFIPDSIDCAQNISLALDNIFRRENGISLSMLQGKGRREARQYLDSLQGVTPFAAAAVQLWSLGGHAIPVNRRLLETLRREKLVDVEAEVEVVQAFLERNIPADQAKDFCHVMAKFASQRGPRVASKQDGTGQNKKKAAKKAKKGSAATGKTKRAKG